MKNGEEKSMRIAVCDDSEDLRKRLIESIQANDTSDDLEITEFEDGKYLLEGFESGKYDLIFLDYYMKFMNGMDTASRIRDMDRKVMIVFATFESGLCFGSDIASLRVNKPMRKEEYENVMKIYEERKNSEEEHCFEFTESGKKRCLLVKHIIYARGRELCMLQGDFTTDTPVLIDGGDKVSFYTTDDGYQINLYFVRKVSWCKVELIGKKEIKMRFKEWWRFRKQFDAYQK